MKSANPRGALALFGLAARGHAGLLRGEAVPLGAIVALDPFFSGVAFLARTWRFSSTNGGLCFTYCFFCLLVEKKSRSKSSRARSTN